MVAIQSINDISLIMANTPQCLRVRSQWVVWRREERNGKWTKVPYDAKTGHLAKSTAQATWSTFEQAVDAYRRRECYDGVGFVFTKGDPFCGVDLDDCRRDDGTLAPWAQEIVDQLASYSEISPSDTGVKIFLVGKKPDFARSAVKNIAPEGEPGGMEIYQDGRYFTVTGNILPGSPADVQDCQPQLDALCRRFWSPDQPKPPSTPPAAQAQAPEISSHRDDRVGRCLAEMLKMKVADQNDGSHRLFAAACRCVEHDLSDSEAQLCIWTYGRLRPFPRPWSHGDVLKRVRDAEDHVNRGEARADESGILRPAFKTLGELVMEYPELRPPVIHGLLRQGETMNVIAAPKVGKSWLAIDLAMAVATGRPWLDTYPTNQGKVLILDNELHGETSANRIPKVAVARAIDVHDIASMVCVENMRGKLVDLIQLESYFSAIEPGTFKIVVLDAFYRFVPRDSDENDNGTVAQLYNYIDRYAQRLCCSFILIHHSTKGTQTFRAITDVGAGAGSQSRATDTHLILRPHQQEHVVVLDAAVRSWPPISPICLEWTYPIWNRADGLNPSELRVDRKRRTEPASAEPKDEMIVWDTDTFVSKLIAAEPRTRAAILEAAEKAGLSERRAETLLKRAEDNRQAYRWQFASNEPVKYATVQQPLLDVPVVKKKSKRK